MGLPLLKDFLPQGEPGPGGQVPFPPLRTDFLDEHEAALIGLEAHTAALRGALERFVSVMQQSLPDLDEDDLVRAFGQIEREETRNRSILSAQIQEAEGGRARATSLRESPFRTRALQRYDREIRILRQALASFDWAKEQMETLRDTVLVREAQEFSARRFWGEDDES